MKIRNGFVSNSSSASFVIGLHRDKDDFLHEIKNEFGNTYFDLEYLKETLDRLIKIDPENSYFTEKYNATLKAIDEKDYEAILSLYYNICIVQRGEYRISVSGDTTMFNDTQDVPKIMRDILCFYMFTYPNVVLYTEVED